MYFGLIVPAYGMYSGYSSSNCPALTNNLPGYAYFAPSIIQSYGYSRKSPPLKSSCYVKHANKDLKPSKHNSTPSPLGQPHLDFQWQ